MLNLEYDEKAARRALIKDEKIDIAKRLLKMGLPIKQVVEGTQLSEEEVMRIKTRLKL